MSQIKSKDTKPELLVRGFLFANGFRYRLHVNKLPGKPDIVLPKLKTAIFVHGCFWHGHTNCRYFIVPKTNTEFWLTKIQGNQRRDTDNFSRLIKEGWNIINIFECGLRNKKEQTLKKLLNRLTKISEQKKK